MDLKDVSLAGWEDLCPLGLRVGVRPWGRGASGWGGGVPVRPSTGEVGGNSPVSQVMSELLGVKL